MGFLDRIGKNVSDAGQKTAQIAKEMAEINRLNTLISQNEGKINNLYYQIGALYVKVHGNDSENEFREMVESVMELQQQNENFSNLILEKKGVQKCEKCGAIVPREALFCSSCGSKMPKEEKVTNDQNYVKCPGCGNLVKKGMRFCTSCGRAMITPVMASQAAEETVEIEEAAIVEMDMRVCSNCGEKVNDGSLFCPECGTKL